MPLHTRNLTAAIRTRGSQIGTAVIGLFLLNACTLLAPPPLDPVIGDTGQPLSANASAYDVIAYAMDLTVLPDSQRIEGSGTTELRALSAMQVIELKLDSRFDVSGTDVNGVAMPFHRNAGVITIELATPLSAGDIAKARIHYAGRPHVAKNAPWDGGIVWAKTDQGQPWIATAVQGEGCDLWWPCKDHFSDKPERVDMRITVPKGLSVAMNGKLQSVQALPDGRNQFHWLLGVPASDYNISLNVGPFVRIQDHYLGINGSDVPIEFWALPEHEQKARDLINNDLRNQVAFYEMMLGPFPWGGEKMGFVETPHLGMEHQTLNAYGKGYKRDENGFDWLLQHELAHEWFGNLMTHERLNDAWLHEGFGLYMQPAYARYRFGEAAYHASMYKAYLGLKNCAPVVLDGTPTSTEAFNSDIYGKGGWTLHTLRWLIGEEAFWRATRRLLYDTAEPWTLTYPIAPRSRNTEAFVRIASEEAGRDLHWLFDVYLRQAELPELITERTATGLTLRWQVKDDKPFPMPVPVSVNGNLSIVPLTDGHAFLPLAADAHVIIDPEMYVLRYLPIIGDCKENTAKSKSRK